MDLPVLVILLIGVVIAAAAFVVAAMYRKRDHPLRGRFKDYDRKRNQSDDQNPRR